MNGAFERFLCLLSVLVKRNTAFKRLGSPPFSIWVSQELKEFIIQKQILFIDFMRSGSSINASPGSVTTSGVWKRPIPGNIKSCWDFKIFKGV